MGSRSGGDTACAARDIEGRRLAEAAEILEIRVGTVKSRMHSATRLLRGWLGSDDEEEKR